MNVLDPQPETPGNFARRLRTGGQTVDSMAIRVRIVLLELYRRPEPIVIKGSYRQPGVRGPERKGSALALLAEAHTDIWLEREDLGTSLLLCSALSQLMYPISLSSKILERG
jgi:hypothetical protein